jgi:cytochrome c biogenesis protein CcdA
MEFLLLSLIAGMLTVLSPCILPLLPVILSGALGTKNKAAPYVIIGSSALSIILFTLLLKGTSTLIGIPSSAWFTISGLIITLVGVSFIFPGFWEAISSRLRISERSGKLTSTALGAHGQIKNIILGASLGPVFTSCSPTYAIVVATVLPADFLLGTIYVVSYALGLSLVLLALTLGGQNLVGKIQWATTPAFQRSVGIVLVTIGFLIMTGLIKDVETWLVGGWFDSTRFEWTLLND